MTMNPPTRPLTGSLTRTVGRSAVASLAASSLALCALFSLAACGTATPTRYYAVEGTSTVERPAGYRGRPVQVRELRIPASMDRPELTRERAGGEVQLREFDRWAAPLDRSARQALTQSLASRLPPGAVVFAGAVRPVDRIDLSVEVLSLRIAEGSASMWVAWGAQRQPPVAWPAGGASGPGSAQTGVPTPVHELRLTTPATDDAAGTARAWSALLGQLADRIATALTDGSAATP